MAESKLVTLYINEKEYAIHPKNKEKLIETLRGLNFVSVKNGCNEGDCGLCTVLLDGDPVRSCLLLTKEMDQKHITTVEGLSPDGKSHPIQTAFMETGAIQCGFCTPAHILTSKALLDKNPAPPKKNPFSVIWCSLPLYRLCSHY